MSELQSVWFKTSNEDYVDTLVALNSQRQAALGEIRGVRDTPLTKRSAPFLIFSARNFISNRAQLMSEAQNKALGFASVLPPSSFDGIDGIVDYEEGNIDPLKFSAAVLSKHLSNDGEVNLLSLARVFNAHDVVSLGDLSNLPLRGRGFVFSEQEVQRAWFRGLGKGALPELPALS